MRSRADELKEIALQRNPSPKTLQRNQRVLAEAILELMEREPAQVLKRFAEGAPKLGELLQLPAHPAGVGKVCEQVQIGEQSWMIGWSTGQASEGLRTRYFEAWRTDSQGGDRAHPLDVTTRLTPETTYTTGDAIRVGRRPLSASEAIVLRNSLTRAIEYVESEIGAPPDPIDKGLRLIQEDIGDKTSTPEEGE